jgi:hypothetical protein
MKAPRWRLSREPGWCMQSDACCCNGEIGQIYFLAKEESPSSIYFRDYASGVDTVLQSQVPDHMLFRGARACQQVVLEMKT